MGAQSEVTEGEQRTQIELLESNEPAVPLKEVILGLKVQLELCRKHYGASQWINYPAKLIQKISQTMRYGSAPIFLLLAISEHLKPIIARKIAIL
jgi:hypothetical protein